MVGRRGRGAAVAGRRAGVGGHWEAHREAHRGVREDRPGAWGEGTCAEASLIEARQERRVRHPILPLRNLSLRGGREKAQSPEPRIEER